MGLLPGRENCSSILLGFLAGTDIIQISERNAFRLYLIKLYMHVLRVPIGKCRPTDVARPERLYCRLSNEWQL